MKGFSVERVHKVFGGLVFEGRDKILTSGKDLKFRVIFQMCIKIKKNWKIIEKIREKNFSEIF